MRPLLAKTSQLQHLAENLINSSYQKGTRTAYIAQWKLFMEFCSNLNLSNFPISHNIICLFISHLHQAGFQSSTIRNYVASIACNLKLRNHIDVTNNFIVKRCLAGVKKVESVLPPSTTPLSRKPISKLILHKLVDHIQVSEPDHYLKCMFTCLFLLTYYLCLRAGEIVQSKNTDHLLTIDQVVKCKNSLPTSFLFNFRSFKHSKEPCCIKLNSMGGEFCPVQALVQFLSIRSNAKGPLFIDQIGKTVTRHKFANVLKSAVSSIGLSPNLYNTHCFRIGRITDLAAEGAPRDVIQAVGRWRSNAFLKYIKPANTEVPL